MNRGVPVNRRSMRAARVSLYAAVWDGSWDVVQVKLTNFATTTAVSTAVAAVVATVLLFVSLVFVVSVRWLVVPNAPSATHQDLFLDFTLPEPSAVAVFMPAHAIDKINALAPDRITASVLRSHRIVASGQKFDVSLRFEVPETKHNTQHASSFQVTCQLLTASGVVLANASRPVNIQFSSYEVRLLRLFLKWPLFVTGLATETQRVTLPMFASMHEKKDLPFTTIKTTVSARHGLQAATGVPQIYHAAVDIALDMNPVSKFLHDYPHSSFVLMLGATWGYLCAFAFALVAVVVGLGLVKSPSKFAQEVVARALELMKGNAGGGEALDLRFPQTSLFEGTSSDDENKPGPVDYRRKTSAESDDDDKPVDYRRKTTSAEESNEQTGGESDTSDLGGETTAGLRYRGAPRAEGGESL